MIRSHAWTGLAAAALIAIASIQPAGATRLPDWSLFRAPLAVIIQGYDGDAMEPFLSRDGRLLFFNNRNGPGDQTDLHWAERIDDLTFRYRGPVDGANSVALDGVATMSAHGRFCFVSPRAYAETLATVFCGEWRGEQLAAPTLQRDAAPRIAGRVVFDVEIDALGETLILADGLFRGGDVPAAADLRQARWIDGAFRLTPADDRLFAAINTGALEYAAALSADGRLLAFTRLDGQQAAIWIARRARLADPFGPPVRIAAIEGFAEAPTFAPGGRALYFHRRIGGRFSIWRVAR